MVACLDWLVNYDEFESVEQMMCLDVSLERLWAVASSERNLPFDLVLAECGVCVEERHGQLRSARSREHEVQCVFRVP